jgi:hypothetical protein
MANEHRNRAREVFGVSLPGTALKPDKQRISDELFGGIDSALAEIVAGLATVQSGTHFVDPVVAATTTAVALSSLTAGSTLDGVTLVAGNRILNKDASTASQNGIYVIAASGAPSRSTDADTGTELRGLAVFVSGGTVNGGTQWGVSFAVGVITVGTTSIPFTLLSDQRALNTTLASLSAQLASPAALVSSAVNSASAVTDLQDADLIPLRRGTSLNKVTIADLARLLEDKIVPRTYPRLLKGLTVSGTSQLVLAPDPFRRGISLVQCRSADVFLNQLGEEAVFENGGGNSEIKAASGGVDIGDVGTGGISIIARNPDGTPLTSPVKITIRVLRTVDADPSSVTEGDRALVGWTDPVDARLRTVVRDQINTLASSGHWTKATDFRLYLGSTATNNAVNLRAPTGVKATYFPGSTGIVTTPYRDTAGGGTDARINTNRSAADCGVSTDNILVMVKSTTAGVDTSGLLTGFASNAASQPNRSATEIAIRSGGGVDIFASGGPGKNITFRRTDSASYDYFIGTTKTNAVRVSTTLPPERILHDLASGSSTADGYSAATIVPIQMRMVGPGVGFTDSAIAAWNSAFTAIAAQAAVIYAELHP